MKKAERICKLHDGPAERRYQKRKLRRARRRDERRDPEMAGTRIRDYTRGWTD